MFKDLLNKIWRSEYVPQDDRNAAIIPVCKKGNKMDCKNYLGISFLKMTNQADFHTGMDCVGHIFQLRILLYQHYIYNQEITAIFLDFIAVFDYVLRLLLWETMLEDMLVSHQSRWAQEGL